MLAKIDLNEGKYDDARTRTLAATNIQHLGDREREATSLLVLSRIDFRCLRYGDARIRALKSLEIFRTIGDEAGRGWALSYLAQIDNAEGRFNEARRQALESLAISLELGSLGATAFSLDSIARVDYSEGRYEDARSRAIQSLRIFEKTGGRPGLAISLLLLGQIAARLRLSSNAFDLAELAVLISTEIGLARELVSEDFLTALAVNENYSEQQIADMKQRVFEAYQKDKGKEMVENALIRLQQVDASNDPT
jgi:tetratricopeptide (TPR) repeat protein